ncbi:MAG: PAS domain-containing protein [Patescibacteria group bacterium]|nr:PAS domain-containing protein [Patescibacteria group bacterium]
MSKANVYKFSLDAHGFVVEATPNFCELLGLHFSRKCVPRFDSFVSRESGSAFLQSTLDAYRGLETRRILISIISKDGEKKYGHLSLAPSIVDESDLVLGLKGVFELKF